MFDAIISSALLWLIGWTTQSLLADGVSIPKAAKIIGLSLRKARILFIAYPAIFFFMKHVADLPPSEISIVALLWAIIMAPTALIWTYHAPKDSVLRLWLTKIGAEFGSG